MAKITHRLRIDREGASERVALRPARDERGPVTSGSAAYLAAPVSRCCSAARLRPHFSHAARRRRRRDAFRGRGALCNRTGRPSIECGSRCCMSVFVRRTVFFLLLASCARGVGFRRALACVCVEVEAFHDGRARVFA
jgi:hypothetical protein